MDNVKLKKVRISVDDLPEIDPGNSYYIRYRIVSDDNNLKSHWSWVYGVVSEQAKKNILDGGEIV